MSEPPPDEPSIPVAGADPGKPKVAAHEERGVPQSCVEGAAQGTRTPPARPASAKRRGPSVVRQRDVMRMVKGTQGAGLPVKRVEYENGKIAVVIGEPDKLNACTVEKNEWDEVFDGATKTATR
jgi:hypothetical protein